MSLPYILCFFFFCELCCFVALIKTQMSISCETILFDYVLNFKHSTKPPLFANSIRLWTFFRVIVAQNAIKRLMLELEQLKAFWQVYSTLGNVLMLVVCMLNTDNTAFRNPSQNKHTTRYPINYKLLPKSLMDKRNEIIQMWNGQAATFNKQRKEKQM